MNKKKISKVFSLSRRKITKIYFALTHVFNLKIILFITITKAVKRKQNQKNQQILRNKIKIIILRRVIIYIDNNNHNKHTKHFYKFIHIIFNKQ